MANSNWSVLLKAELDKTGVNSDLKTIQGILDRSTLKMMPKLQDADIRNQIQSISSLIAKDLNKTYNLKINSKDVMSALKSVEKEFGVTEQQAQKLQASLNLNKSDFLNKTTAYLRSNTALSKELAAEIVNIQKAVDRVDDASGLRNLERQFKSVQLQAKATGQTGRNMLSQIGLDVKNFSQFLGAGTLVMQTINQIRNAVNEFKEVDTILTEISKTSGQTREELEGLGKTAYESASAYGRTVTDYLDAVKEMNRAGFYGESGNKMAELSLLAQSAGDLDSTLANDYLLASNAAYQLGGDIEKLNGVLDGQDLITNRNAISMQDMTSAMTVVGSQAANSRVNIDELSAAIGTMVSSTRKSGNEVATSLKAIFINLQNVASDKINNTLKAAGTSMTVMKDGIEQLRTPMEILKDLAKTYRELDDADPLKAQITTNIGGKHHADICVYVQKCAQITHLIAGSA